MARVECEIEESLIEVNGKTVNGIVVTCGRCGHEVELPGYDCPATRRKAVKLLHATCPEHEGNSYRLPDLVTEQGKMNMENDATD